MSDKQRAAFEVWCHNNPLKTDRRPNGDYKYTSTDLAWQAWQAAIESVVVELPPRMRGIDEACRINNKAVDMMASALSSAGVAYK